VIDSIRPLFAFLDALHDSICRLTDPMNTEDAEDTIHQLAWLAEELSGELKRRTD
jgi:hypothetical protein